MTIKNTLEKTGPGTGQVNLGGVITMAMVVIAWVVVEYTAFNAPEYVWTAITGLVICSSQYWHGPK